jgi:hypothetical protein
MYWSDIVASADWYPYREQAKCLALIELAPQTTTSIFNIHVHDHNYTRHPPQVESAVIGDSNELFVGGHFETRVWDGYAACCRPIDRLIG